MFGLGLLLILPPTVARCISLRIYSILLALSQTKAAIVFHFTKPPRPWRSLPHPPNQGRWIAQDEVEPWDPPKWASNRVSWTTKRND
jgi:hypothetical protein